MQEEEQSTRLLLFFFEEEAPLRSQLKLDILFGEAFYAKSMGSFLHQLAILQIAL
jgi:hypothetical protein